MKAIIIGAGIAAVSAMKAIRQQDPDMEITVYGDEGCFPYRRLRLTKDINRGLLPDALLIQKESWYLENHIRFCKGTGATGLDPARHRVILSDGTTDEYSVLLLANGARSNVLPIRGIDRQGVYSLRTLQDSSAILEQAKRSRRILIVGGGVLGLELTWSLNQMGKEVVVAEAQPRLMPKQLDEKASQILLDVVQSCGVSVYTDTRIKEITGESFATGFRTDNDLQESCDMVIHSTGIRPNIELVKGTGIRTNQGIPVNGKMETNLADIYAAGDVAEFENRVAGLWNCASLQGEVAGINMAGGERTYQTPAAATIMNAFRTSLFSIGQVEEGSYDAAITDFDCESNRYRKICFRRNQISGVVIIGSRKELPALKKAMEEKISFGSYEQYGTVSEFMKLVQEQQRANKPIPQ